jgi:hypothetical protein
VRRAGKGADPRIPFDKLAYEIYTAIKYSASTDTLNATAIHLNDELPEGAPVGEYQTLLVDREERLNDGFPMI